MSHAATLAGYPARQPAMLFEPADTTDRPRVAPRPGALPGAGSRGQVAADVPAKVAMAALVADSARLRLVVHPEAATWPTTGAMGFDDWAERAQPLRVRVENASGQCVAMLNDATDIIDLSLPAGAYSVTTQLGEVERHYLLNLAGAQRQDLHLRTSVGR